jgi:hypothetical protein
MKRGLAFLFGVLILALFSSSWAQFPCNPGDSVGTDCCGADSGDNAKSWDLGLCDTLHVVPWPETDTCFIYCFGGSCDTMCINTPGEEFPCFAFVNILVTHDSNTHWWRDESKWVQDSVSAFVFPLVWTHTNPAAYCSLPGYWNANLVSDLNPYTPNFPRSIWRHFQSSTLGNNRMADLAALFQGKEWATVITDWTNDSSWYKFSGETDSVFTPPRFWTSLVPTNPTNQRWWEGGRTLLATFTFRVEDTMTICIDSMFWPPFNRLTLARKDGVNYFPRHELPKCFRVAGGATGVRWIEGSAEEENLPTRFSVSQNYPNPFNPATEFKFDLPRASQVKIEVFNILGQRVKILVDERRRAGSHVVDWDGTDNKGAEVSSGVYFYRMTADDFSDIKKMILLK